MNREIEFRGIGQDGELHYGDLSILRNKMDGIEAGFYISNSAGMPYAYKIDEKTIGQFIGLKDKNGKRIFEGDIIRFFEPDSIWIFQVVYVEGKACYSLSSASRFMDIMAAQFDQQLTELYQKHFEVIGCIHTNPERMIKV
jgi:uncharacterized phage protein (TIGR01671 family)